MVYSHPRLVLFTVCLIAILSVAGMALPYPILAPMFVDAPANNFNQFLGLDPKWLFGIALAINPLGIVIGSAILGALSDHYGRRPVLMLALGLATLGYGLSAFALLAEHYPLFIFARFITGLCEGAISIARAIAADLHPQIPRQKSMSLVNGALHAGWLVGPLVGGLTVGLGNHWPFLLAALAMLPCVALVIMLLPNNPHDAQSTAAEAAEANIIRQGHAFSLWQHIKAHNSLNLAWLPALRTVALIQLIYTIGLNGFYEFYPLWLVEAERFSAEQIGIITAVLCSLMIATNLGPLAKMKTPANPTRYAATAMICLALAIVLLPQLQHWPAWLTLVLCGIPIAATSTFFTVYCADQFAAHGQGKVMGMLTMLMCMGNIFIALAGSLLAMLSTGLTLVISGLCCGIAAWLLWRLTSTTEVADPPLGDAKH